MSKLGTGLRKSAVVLLFAATALGQAPAKGHAGSAIKPVVLPAGDVKWVDAPNAPPGVKEAVLWGDPTKGRFGTLEKFPAGFSAPLHWHTANLRMVVVSGTVIHGAEGKPAVKLTAGSYLLEPSGYRHTTACDAASECVFFMEGDGTFDLVMADKK